MLEYWNNVNQRYSLELYLHSIIQSFNHSIILSFRISKLSSLKQIGIKRDIEHVAIKPFVQSVIHIGPVRIKK